MSEVATDSTAPEQGQAAPPAAKKGTVDEAASRFAALLGGRPPEDNESPEGAPVEASADGEEEAEGQQDAKEPTAALVKVKVDGEEIEVPLEEALQGYQRTADYTRKTQALAEQRKALEAELEQARAERSQYEQAIQWAKSQLESQMQDEPDWKKLADEDPIEFVKQKELWRDRKEQLAAVQAEQRRLAEQQQKEFAAKLQQKIAEENERLLDVFKDWRQPEVRTQAQTRLLEYGKSMGFSEQELAQVYDHRAIVMLEKARAYDELMAKGQQKLKEAPAKSPAAAKPGTVASRQVNRELVDAKARLRQTGKVKDAAAALQRLFATR